MTAKKRFSEDNEKKARAAQMIRSRGQLSTAYAPGALFTFEGGLGACLSIPEQTQNPAKAQISRETETQVHLRLREVWQSWFTRAMEGGTPNHPALPIQCLDTALLRDDRYHAPAWTRFELVDPKAIGYIPAPLDFVCNTCGRFRKFDSMREAVADLDGLKSARCDTRRPEHKGKCRWRQLDIVFVHWSGNWEAPTPGRWEWSVPRQEVLQPMRSCGSCDSRKFYLIDKSPRIGEWVFECENGHKDGDSWLQNDPITTQLLGDESTTRPPRWRRMEPISYRATPAFYPHSEQFVILAAEQADLLEMLQEGREAALAAFAAERYGLGGRPLQDEEIVDILRKAGYAEKVQQYEFTKQVMISTAGTPMADQARDRLKGLIKDWCSTPGLVPPQHEVPQWLTDQIARRPDFGSRYDPLVLAVEHEALKRSTLNATTTGGMRSHFVRFDQSDSDLAPASPRELEEQRLQASIRLRALGMEEMGLVREFQLCRFTHGYTRMSTEPLIEKSDQQALMLPVRLNLFPSLGNNKIPIYVVTQANEAFYVRLSPRLVYAWLRAVGVTDLPDWDADGSIALGAHVLSSAAPFGKYFSDLDPAPANTYRYVYTLLHTYAHTLMKGIAEFSGLDLGSLGEYLFPADLAFVVYRNGTTMDLGNLSSLWRNYNTVFLDHLLEPRTLMCGSGSLCDSSGGACPSCIVVPETSCVAANQLLSRSVLRGGPAPREDQPQQGQQIAGFLDIVRTNNAPARRIGDAELQALRN